MADKKKNLTKEDVVELKNLVRKQLSELWSLTASVKAEEPVEKAIHALESLPKNLVEEKHRKGFHNFLSKIHNDLDSLLDHLHTAVTDPEFKTDSSGYLTKLIKESYVFLHQLITIPK